MYSSLNDCQKRYIQALRPHIDEIIVDMNEAFRTRKKVTQGELAKEIAKKSNVKSSLVLIGFALLIKEGVILGVVSAKKAGLLKVGHISHNKNYEFGDNPEPKHKRSGSYFNTSKELGDAAKPITNKSYLLSELKKCIKGKCLDCANDSKEEVINCAVPRCSLYSVRPYKTKEQTIENGIQTGYVIESVKEPNNPNQSNKDIVVDVESI
jgi:hypothetical protein